MNDDQRRLYRAYSYWYGKEANLRRTIFICDVAFAAVGFGLAVWTTVVGPTPEVVSKVTAAGGVTWLLGRELIARRGASAARRTAVKIQQRFDLSFYGPWKEHWNPLLLGPPIPEPSTRDAAKRYDGDDVPDDYWVDTTGLNDEQGALARTYQTAIWGAGLHGEYAALTIKVTGVLLAVIVITLLTSDVGLLTAAPAIITIAPLLVGRVQSSIHHRELANRRQTLATYASNEIEASSLGVSSVRLAQDEVARLRLADRRTPQWLYDMRRKSYLETHDTSAADLVRSVLARHSGIK
jgi:hypothetical protein